MEGLAQVEHIGFGGAVVRHIWQAQDRCAGYLLYLSAKLACKNLSFCLLLLDDSSEEEYNRKHASAHLYQGGMETVQRILTFITWLTGYCLKLLNDCFVAWTTVLATWIVRSKNVL